MPQPEPQPTDQHDLHNNKPQQQPQEQPQPQQQSQQQTQAQRQPQQQHTRNKAGARPEKSTAQQVQAKTSTHGHQDSEVKLKSHWLHTKPKAIKGAMYMPLPMRQQRPLHVSTPAPTLGEDAPNTQSPKQKNKPHKQKKTLSDCLRVPARRVCC